MATHPSDLAWASVSLLEKVNVPIAPTPWAACKGRQNVLDRAAAVSGLGPAVGRLGLTLSRPGAMEEQCPPHPLLLPRLCGSAVSRVDS